MNRDPITRQRSSWVRRSGEHVDLALDVAEEVTTTLLAAYERSVHDGTLTALVGDEPQGWHLSISHRGNGNRAGRYPTWDEIAHARDELLPSDVEFVMYLPRDGEYVALHRTTFHLHEHPERSS